MGKIENGCYKFGDKNDTTLKVREGSIVVNRETSFTKKTIEIFPPITDFGKVTIMSNSMWKRKFRNATGVEKILTKAGVSMSRTKQDIKTLKKLLTCSTVEQLEENFQSNDVDTIHEWNLLSILNGLFSIMFL